MGAIRAGIFVAAQIIVTVIGTRASHADDLPTAEQLVATLQRQVPQFKNHHSVMIYEERIEGQPSEWCRATLFADEFGRVLNVDEFGSRDADGTFHAKIKRSSIFNGEISMLIDHTYDRRLGPFNGCGKSVHASILIVPEGDARSGTADHLPGRGVLRTYGSLLFVLRDSLDKQEPITMTRAGDPTDGLIQIILKKTVPEFGTRTETYVVDMNKGAALKFRRATNYSGQRLSEYEAEYSEMPPGSNRWAISKGVNRLLLPITSEISQADGRKKKVISPPRESRFECLEYRNDDPKFSSDVFNINLPKGTYIWDPRIQSDYRQDSDVEIRPPLPTERKLLFGHWRVPAAGK